MCSLLQVRIALSKFLPQIFIDAMTDNPEASVTMFEGNHENPELVWNDDTREKVRGVGLNEDFLLLKPKYIPQRPFMSLNTFILQHYSRYSFLSVFV